MLLAVLFCTSAMCICDIYADSITSTNAHISKNETIQDSLSNVKSTVINSEDGAYSDEEVYLTAQLVYHEAHNQAYNGKVAIAEVVLNRVKSTLFPNSIESVIFQSGQFTSIRRLKNINPTELELRIAYNVLNGNLRVLNDEDILYFRNPKVTSGVAASLDKNWGSLDYETHIGDHAFYSQQAPKSLAKSENTEADSKKPSFLDKLPNSLNIAKFFTPKKAKNNIEDTIEKEAEDKVDNTLEGQTTEANLEEIGQIALADDSLGIQNEEDVLLTENLTEEDKALEKAKRLEKVLSAHYYAQLALQNGEPVEELNTEDEEVKNAEDKEAQNAEDEEELESLEVINVDNVVFLAQAQALALELKKDDKSAAHQAKSIAKDVAKEAKGVAKVAAKEAKGIAKEAAGVAKEIAKASSAGAKAGWEEAKKTYKENKKN